MDTIVESSRHAAIHELIAVRAYKIWENQGRPRGFHLLNWHQAEQEIMSCVDDGKGVPAHESLKAKSPAS